MAIVRPASGLLFLNVQNETALNVPVRDGTNDCDRWILLPISQKLVNPVTPDVLSKSAAGDSGAVSELIDNPILSWHSIGLMEPSIILPRICTSAYVII